MAINTATVSGNLTRDAELKGTALTWTVAVNDRVKNQDTQEWEDRANFIDCVMFGARAEKVAPYLTKGAKVAVTGRLRWHQWETDGQKRSKVEIVAAEVVFMYQARAEIAPAYDEDVPF